MSDTPEETEVEVGPDDNIGRGEGNYQDDPEQVQGGTAPEEDDDL
jgi:hypothetical protein